MQKKGAKTTNMKPLEELQSPQSPQTSATVDAFTITQPDLGTLHREMGSKKNFWRPDS